jgi:hypothetical protein
VTYEAGIQRSWKKMEVGYRRRYKKGLFPGLHTTWACHADINT